MHLLVTMCRPTDNHSLGPVMYAIATWAFSCILLLNHVGKIIHMPKNSQLFSHEDDMKADFLKNIQLICKFMTH